MAGLYYTVAGPQGVGNRGESAEYDTSAENNASLAAGLMILHDVLKKGGGNTSSIALIEKILGINPDGTTDGNSGIMHYFKNVAWKDGIFIQGTRGKALTPVLEPKAVDVNTWGITVLGQPLVDSWFGDGAACKAWEKVKQWGGYKNKSGEFVGVGYSNKDNGAIISAEWTAGAINLVRALIHQYGDASKNCDVEQLKTDLAGMLKGLASLRISNYATDAQYADVRPKNYSSLLRVDDFSSKNLESVLYPTFRIDSNETNNFGFG